MPSSWIPEGSMHKKEVLVIWGAGFGVVVGM